MTNYARGATFERAVLHDMERHGYHAIRAAGSHTPADVYCIGNGRVVYIQCKLDGRLRVAEWNEFLAYCSEVGAVPIVAYKEPRTITYKRITGIKDGTRKAQPWEEWKP